MIFTPKVFNQQIESDKHMMHQVDWVVWFQLIWIIFINNVTND